MVTSQQLKAKTKAFTELDIAHLVIEDDTPVDNFQSEQQQRLLVEPLYSSRILPLPFLAAANVGLFYQPKTDPIVPDVLLSLGVSRPEDFAEKKNRCYIVEEIGKLPEVCIEIVSNRKGDELTISRASQRKRKTECKRDIYEKVGIKYYVVFDPLKKIQTAQEMNQALLRVWKMIAGRYTEVTTPAGIKEIGEWILLEEVGLGLQLWSGEFEDESTKLWLRWCDVHGQVVPTGAEAKEFERQRAEQERQRAEQEHQRAEQERQRAEQERQRAEQEHQRAEQSDQLARRLAAQLRSLGIDPDQIT